MSDANLNAVNTSGLTVIGTATSKKPSSERWTTLTLWYREGRRPVLAEVYGGTTVPGEQNRRRRRVFANVEDALAFFEPGTLNNKVRRNALAWCRLCNPALKPRPTAPKEG